MALKPSLPTPQASPARVMCELANGGGGEIIGGEELPTTLLFRVIFWFLSGRPAFPTNRELAFVNLTTLATSPRGLV